MEWNRLHSSLQAGTAPIGSPFHGISSFDIAQFVSRRRRREMDVIERIVHGDTRGTLRSALATTVSLFCGALVREKRSRRQRALVIPRCRLTRRAQSREFGTGRCWKRDASLFYRGPLLRNTTFTIVTDGPRSRESPRRAVKFSRAHYQNPERDGTRRRLTVWRIGFGERTCAGKRAATFIILMGVAFS